MVIVVSHSQYVLIAERKNYIAIALIRHWLKCVIRNGLVRVRDHWPLSEIERERRFLVS